MKFIQWKSDIAFKPCFDRIIKKNKFMKQAWIKIVTPDGTPKKELKIMWQSDMSIQGVFTN